MQVTPYRTVPVIKGMRITDVLDTSLPKLEERDIVVVTSKIVSICQGRIQPATTDADKFDLVRKEAQYFIENEATSRYHLALTITNHVLIPNSGIDESNGNQYYILWPSDPMGAAKEIWEYLRKKHHVDDLGVIITDSHTTPLRWGTSGIGLAWCGFNALNTYIGQPDVFGRLLEVTKASVIDGLSAAAVVTMGEGKEQTPIAIIRDTPFVHFNRMPPSKEEIESFPISLEEDLYSPILTPAPWEKGGASK